MGDPAVRVTIEMELIPGKDFTPESENSEEIIAAAVWRFVEILDTNDIFDYIQTKIVEEPS